MGIDKDRGLRPSSARRPSMITEVTVSPAFSRFGTLLIRSSRPCIPAGSSVMFFTAGAGFENMVTVSQVTVR